MAPLWDGFFAGRMHDAVTPRTVSCCTKWAAGDRDGRPEWRFEYDHIFYSADLKPLAGDSHGGVAPPLPFLPYAYPGLAQPCADASCTGEDPPGNVTATAQGSWHRYVYDLNLLRIITYVISSLRIDEVKLRFSRTRFQGVQQQEI